MTIQLGCMESSSLSLCDLFSVADGVVGVFSSEACSFEDCSTADGSVTGCSDDKWTAAVSVLVASCLG